MGLDLQQLLSIPVTRAFDIDDHGRVLAGSDTSGSLQLIEIDPDGSVRELTALPGACTGRYVPGARTVIVSHDDGGNERTQLSLLQLSTESSAPARLEDLTPLVRDPRFLHDLEFVERDRLGYTTNRRNGVDFDVIIRDLTTGAETLAYLGHLRVAGLALSPDGRRLALSVFTDLPNSQQLLLVDPDRPEDPPIALTDAAEPALVPTRPGPPTARACSSRRISAATSPRSPESTSRPVSCTG
ncbi:MAG TPA: hypothetical protein VGJ28_11285 [Micromonosporaceae bacterium]|jgi:hypothetical protein